MDRTIFINCYNVRVWAKNTLLTLLFSSLLTDDSSHRTLHTIQTFWAHQYSPNWNLFSATHTLAKFWRSHFG